MYLLLTKQHHIRIVASNSDPVADAVNLWEFIMSPSRPRDNSKVAQISRGREDEIFSRERIEK